MITPRTCLYTRLFREQHLSMLVGGLFALGLVGTAAAGAPDQPAAPTGTVSGDLISLTWPEGTDDEEVSGYNVYRDNQYVTTVRSTTASLRFGDADSVAISIVAFDTPGDGSARGYSIQSQATVFTRDGEPELAEEPEERAEPEEPGVQPIPNNPTTPAELVAERSTENSATLSWQASVDSDGVAGYNVYRDDRYVASVGSPGYIDTGLTAGVAYDYYVVAYDTPRNFSGRSASATAPDQVGLGEIETETETGADTTPPMAPAGVMVTSSATGNLIAWSTASDEVGVAGYNLYRNNRYLTTVPGLFFNDTESTLISDEYYLVAFDDARNFSPRSATASGTDDTTDGGTELTPHSPPDLDEPFADAIPSPSFSDPFGYELETDPESAVEGGAPTQPKNLRLDIVGNDWAEFSWAPSNDDREVVAYEITRSDGVTYTLTSSLPEGLALDAGTYAEYEKYWQTTSFIDCNNTRFAFAPGSDKANDAPWNCVDTGPRPGDDFSYTVAAIDDEGQRSPESETLEIAFAEQINSPVPFYDDIFLEPGDRFASVNNLSEVQHFIEDFDLVFEDDFDTDSIEPTHWNTGLVWADTRIINGEQQYFVNTQQAPDFGYNPFNLDGDADDGALDGEGLSIEAIPIPDSLRGSLPPICDEIDPTGLDRCEFLSGALSSHDRFSFIYGYVEGRIRASSISGALSSFYLYHRYSGGEDDIRLRHGPEIDILEYLGENPFGDADAFQTYHFEDPNTGIIRSSPTMNHEKNPLDSSDVFGGEYHTFGVLWEPQLVIWYIDGIEIKRLRGPQIARQPMNIVNYLVAGSGWAPTPDITQADTFPLNMDIDYIRVYQREAYQGTANFGN